MLAGILALPPAWIALYVDNPILRISAPWDASPDPETSDINLAPGTGHSPIDQAAARPSNRHAAAHSTSAG